MGPPARHSAQCRAGVPRMTTVGPVTKMPRPTPDRTYDDPRDSLLGQVAGFMYWYLVLSLLFALAAAPGLAVLLLLDRSSTNAPLAVLCLLPVGPALSGVLFAARDRHRAEGPTPARSFARGYRLNAVDVLRLWVPALVALALIAVCVVNTDAAGVPDGYAGVLLVIALLTVLWALNALVIASLFAFRTRDVARLGAYYLARLPLVTLGMVSLLVLAGGVVYVTFDAVLVMLGGIWAALLLRNAGPMIRDVQARFTL